MFLQDWANNIKSRFVYDPTIKAFDNLFFKKVSGTGTVVSGDIRLNVAIIASYSQYTYGEFEFLVKVLAAPTAADARYWGLRNTATLRGALFFDITDDVFSFKTYDNDANLTSTTISWNQAGQTWNGSFISFKIVWNEEDIKAYVGGVLMATHKAGDHSLPLALKLANSNSDNMDIDYIMLSKIGTFVG